VAKKPTFRPQFFSKILLLFSYDFYPNRDVFLSSLLSAQTSPLNDYVTEIADDRCLIAF
jgi:hypothetical protein